MKTKKSVSIGLVIVTSLSTVIGYGQSVRNVGDFTGIKVGDMYEITLSQSETNTISIKGDEKDVARIKTNVDNGILSITGDGVNDETTINVGVKSLNSLDVTGSAQVKTSNQLNCDKLSISSNGIENIVLDIHANDIKVSVSGGGDVTLKGNAKTINANVSGTGELKASNLESEKATVKVSGAGDAKVNASQLIDADVSGVGSIIYKGKPVERVINISGAGSVRESKSGNGDETAKDTTNLQLGKKKLIIIDNDDDEKKSDSRKDDFKHWSGFEVGVNGFMDYKNSLDVPNGGEFMQLNYAKSIQFGLNLIEKDFHVYKNYVNIVTGFGFDFNHYALLNNVTLNRTTSVLGATTDSTLKYNKNTLNVSYIKVPLMVEFNTSNNPDNNLHIALGGTFEYKIHSVQKQKYEQNGHDFKTKERDDFNLSPFICNATARVGYNNVTVFANYGLNRLFQKDKGPQLYPFTIGVNIKM